MKEYYREGCNISYTLDNTPVNYLVPRIESIDATSTAVSSLRNYRDDFHQFPFHQPGSFLEEVSSEGRERCKQNSNSKFSHR